MVIWDCEYFAFLVKVVCGSHAGGAGANTEGGVLCGLEFGRVGSGKVGSPGWAGIVKRAANEGLVGAEKCFFVLAPVSAAKGSKYVTLTRARCGE